MSNVWVITHEHPCANFVGPSDPVPADGEVCCSGSGCTMCNADEIEEGVHVVAVAQSLAGAVKYLHDYEDDGEVVATAPWYRQTDGKEIGRWLYIRRPKDDLIDRYFIQEHAIIQ